MNVVDTNNNDEEIEKTLAILIGLIAAVALIILFLSFLSKLCDNGKGNSISHFNLSFYFSLLLSHHFHCLFLNKICRW